MDKIKIVFTMIHYPVAMGRYIWEAFLRREDVEIFSAGPYSVDNIPWKGGMKLPKSYLLPPDLPMPFIGTPSVNYSYLEKKLPWKPDLFLEVNGGLQSPESPVSAPYAVVGTDPHVLNYDNVRVRANKFFCMQKPYMKSTDVWLPYAYDPIYHSKTPVPWEEREYDCSLIGLQYPGRIAFFNELQNKGHNVYFDIGKAYHDAREIYHKTKVGFNLSGHGKKDTTARVFELMGFGIVPLLNRVPDLMEMFEENIHYVGFSSVTEAIEKWHWIMDNQEKAQEIAEAGNQAVKPHTWDARAETILKEMDLL